MDRDKPRDGEKLKEGIRAALLDYLTRGKPRERTYTRRKKRRK